MTSSSTLRSLARRRRWTGLLNICRTWFNIMPSSSQIIIIMLFIITIMMMIITKPWSLSSPSLEKPWHCTNHIQATPLGNSSANNFHYAVAVRTIACCVIFCKISVELSLTISWSLIWQSWWLNSEMLKVFPHRSDKAANMHTCPFQEQPNLGLHYSKDHPNIRSLIFGKPSHFWAIWWKIDG